MHENGEGTPKNQDKAIEWYKRAAAQNDALAMNALARLTDDEAMRKRSIQDFAEVDVTSPDDLDHGDAIIGRFAIPVVSPLYTGEVAHWALWDSSPAAKMKSRTVDIRCYNGGEISQVSQRRLTLPKDSVLAEGMQVQFRANAKSKAQTARITRIHPGPGMFIHLVESKKKGAVAEVQEWEFPGVMKRWGEHKYGDGWWSWWKKQACGLARGVKKVVWKNPTMRNRRASAARRARECLGDTHEYHPTPALGSLAFNCESFVRYCYNGVRRSAQSEKVWGNADGKVPTLLYPFSIVTKKMINNGSSSLDVSSSARASGNASVNSASASASANSASASASAGVDSVSASASASANRSGASPSEGVRSSASVSVSSVSVSDR